MPRLTLDLPADVSIALRKLAADRLTEREKAAVAVLRDWLIGHGYLEQHEIDEDGEVEGNA